MHRNLGTALSDQANTGRADTRFLKIILLTTLCCGFFWPGVVLAGQLHGQIKVNGKSAPGVLVVANCSGQQAASGTTNSFGSYKIHLPKPGPCALQVTYGGQVLQARARSFANPTRYNLIISGSGSSYSMRVE